MAAIEFEPGYQIEGDRPRDECGVFGLYLPGAPIELIEQITFKGLHEEQHRGEESAGIDIANGTSVAAPYRQMGHVRDLYKSYNTLAYRPDGYISIAHTRYSTTGSSELRNAAPFMFEVQDTLSPLFLERISVAHNGNITNAALLKAHLIEQGFTFKSTTDSEVMGALIVAASGNTWEEKITAALAQLEGSFSLVMCTKNALWAARDGMGNRPETLAEVEKDGHVGYAIASETPAFHGLKIHSLKEIPRGGLVKISEKGPETFMFDEETDEAFCGLETAYLMRPDAEWDDKQLYQIRWEQGVALARIHPPPSDIDFVTYIPESPRAVVEGFAAELSRKWGRTIEVKTTMIKNRYGSLNGAVRGFINPSTGNRKEVAKSSYSVFRNVIEGKKIVVIDDSIVEGTTTEGVLAKIYECDPEAVHVRIPFPPVTGPCPFGIDIDEKRPLLAKRFPDLNDRVDHLGAASLGHMNPDQYQESYDAAVGHHRGLCLGCTNGEYPQTIYQTDKVIFEQE